MVPLPGHVVQLVTCLATDVCLTANPGVASSIPARSHTFVEIDHEIISTVILIPSHESFRKGFCQLQAKVCAQSTVMYTHFIYIYFLPWHFPHEP